jgi:hypothetical protein
MLVIVPLNARPIGERAVATMTASGMAGSLAEVVLYRTVAYVRDEVSRGARQAAGRHATPGPRRRR